MCGVTGEWAVGARDRETLHAQVERMCATLTQRGPDDEGVWTDAELGVGLGHRRLSILDLSPAGHQPMESESGRFVIVFNGEIYNHRALRSELDGVVWRGESDTETILAAIEAWGLERALGRFIGMFAFALWDRRDRALSLVRDRLGIKPLCYALTSRGLLFGSELGALRAHDSFEGRVSRSALQLLLRYNSIPAPHTIYEGVSKVMPGTIVRFAAPRSGHEEHSTYWSAAQVAKQGQGRPFEGSRDEAVQALEELLTDAVKLRMLSDVPLGAFLSGGVDSSTVVALMQSLSARPVRTFSIGSSDAVFDEATEAAAVAKHLGTDHTTLYATADDALEVIPRLATMYDEPFADSSQIPTFLVSRLARESVTVALSGDGGDELFAGYNRHVWADRIWRTVGRAPSLLRSRVGHALTAISPDTWDAWFERMAPVLPSSLRHRMPGYKIHKLAAALRAGSAHDFYRGLVSQWRDPSALVRGGLEPTSQPVWGLDDFRDQMMLMDLQRYLPDDILTKVDRASMAVSLEARVPLLDHRVVEFAWRLPLALKLRDGTSKWILRQVLYRHVPKALIERPKAGFGVPIGTWLRGPLRAWAEDLLAEERLTREGFLNPAPIRQAWKEHLAGTHSWEHQLWTVLMFQDWLGAHPSA